jgi:hypothetical protein
MILICLLFFISGPKWNVTRELTEIKSRLEVEGSSETRVTCAMVGTPRVLKPLLIGMAAASLQRGAIFADIQPFYLPIIFNYSTFV